jgi:hypothetical protein
MQIACPPRLPGVIPAKAGTSVGNAIENPAFAGMTQWDGQLESTP